MAIGRGNWTFFGSDNGDKTAAVLLSFIAMCKRNAVEPFAWFQDVLTRIATHPIHRIQELLPAQLENPRHCPSRLNSDGHPADREASSMVVYERCLDDLPGLCVAVPELLEP
jgi:hypothetical protein